MSSVETKPALPLLETLQIASPCSADWEQMVGDDRVRFCNQCQLQVYNLSGMTRSAAEGLVLQREGKMCVRMFRRPDGTVLTQDCPVGLAALRQKVIRAAVGVAALAASMLGGIFAWGMSSSFRGNSTTSGLFSRWTGKAAPPSALLFMGDVCLPAPPILVNPIPAAPEPPEGPAQEVPELDIPTGE